MQGLLSRIAVGVFSLLIVAMVLLALFDERGALALRERRAERDALQSDVDAATKKNEELEAEIKRLREDPEEIERRARELNLVRRNEVILDIQQLHKSTETSTPAK